jgi:hypothetical protein
VCLKDCDRQWCPSVHRLVAKAFIPNPDRSKNVVMHKDDTPSNNCYKNLKWGTLVQNAKDRHRKGRSAVGSSLGKSDLRPRDIRKILKLYATTNLTQREIGKIYGVSDVNISLIVRRKIWVHVV